MSIKYMHTMFYLANHMVVYTVHYTHRLECNKFPNCTPSIYALKASGPRVQIANTKIYEDIAHLAWERGYSTL